MKTINGPILKQRLEQYSDDSLLMDYDGDFQTLRKGMLEMFQNADKSQKDEDAFYEILYDKWREYLHRIKSGVHLIQMLGRDFTSPQDMKEHMEEIKTYMRGHNLFDIFYGRYKKEEKDLLKKYIEIAPRDEFSDILDAADSFIYFQSKTKQKDIQNETK